MRSKINLAIVILIVLGIGYLSLSNLPQKVTQPQGFDISYLGHFLAYFFLSSSLLVYFREKSLAYKEAIILSASYGLILEFSQSMISYRTFSLIDLVFNFSGASLIMLNLKLNLDKHFISMEDKVLEYIS